MKKSLLAIAAMTAFAGAAQAQSSVTVYGILDVGFVGSQYNGVAAAANTSTTGGQAGTGAPAVNGVSAGFGQSAESTSRIGFKGSEDLGGGLSGIFTIETAVNPDGAISAFAFNRQTFVGVKKNGLATATIGTQYTTMFDVQSLTDAAGNNNLVGNAVYATNLQSSTGTYNSGQGAFSSITTTATTGAPISINADSGAYVTRLSNVLKVQSDRFAGLATGVMYAQSNNSQSATAYTGANNNTAFGINADYMWNKLQIVAAFQNVKAQNGVALSSTGTVATGMILPNGTAGTFGNNVNDNQTYAAATYDFGIVKTYAQYVTRKASSTVDSNFQTSRSAYQLGARSQLTPTISVYATYGMGKSSYAQAGTAYANFRTAQLGSDYYLSKRTNLYVAYGSFNQSSPNSAAVPTISSLSGMNYAAGIRHTF
jgi:predicted porin